MIHDTYFALYKELEKDVENLEVRGLICDILIDGENQLINDIPCSILLSGQQFQIENELFPNKMTTWRQSRLQPIYSFDYYRLVQKFVAQIDYSHVNLRDFGATNWPLQKLESNLAVFISKEINKGIFSNLFKRIANGQNDD